MRGVFDQHDDCAGRTIKGMTVRRRCTSEGTWKKMETLRTRVSENHDGCAGLTVVLLTVRLRCPSEDT